LKNQKKIKKKKKKKKKKTEVMKTYLLLLIYLTLALCQESNNELNKFSLHPIHLTSNYTIDFIRNIKPQKCYSNNECPHYSNGCVISYEMIKDKSIPMEGNNISKNLSKEELINYGIYGICGYNYYCTENKDKTIPNNNCIVVESSETIDSTSYKIFNDRNLIGYNLKSGFVRNNITSTYHCNEDSIKNKYCGSEINTSCIKNNDCLSGKCGVDLQCLNSENFYVYHCENEFDSELEKNTNICKKIDNEFCNDSSECSSNFSINGYCLNKIVYDDVHRYDKRDMILNVIGIGLIIIMILIIICLCVCFKKTLKLCFSRKK